MKFCLIGEKLGHSYSREIHEATGLSYELTEVSKDVLSNFFKNNKYDGFNVTIPYKKDVIPFMTGISDVAEECGAVNTVINKNGRFYGYNTDVDGMKYMIARKGIDLKGKHVLILGSGGTSNTAKTLCKIEKAKSIATVSRNGNLNYQNCYDLQDTEIVINATPVGMYPNVENKPINIKEFKNLKAVFDCIYNPFLTDMLKDCKEAGITYSNGLSMLVKQAMSAQDIWMGKRSDDDAVEKIIAKMCIEKGNVVLFGMPSCGKSTIGKKVAEILNREFIDTDELITTLNGKTPSNIINEQGVDEFRNLESAAIKIVANKSGKVIALGGGAILKQENVDALKRNGILIYVKRNLELLTEENRPLSQKYGVEKLYNERKFAYEKAADSVIENNGELDDAVKGVIKEYENTCNKRC